jgi:hypothetical protein
MFILCEPLQFASPHLPNWDLDNFSSPVIQDARCRYPAIRIFNSGLLSPAPLQHSGACHKTVSCLQKEMHFRAWHNAGHVPGSAIDASHDNTSAVVTSQTRHLEILHVPPRLAAFPLVRREPRRLEGADALEHDRETWRSDSKRDANTSITRLYAVTSKGVRLLGIHDELDYE